MTTLGWPIAREPLLEPGDLDVVGLVAVEREPLGVVGHEREAVDLAAQPDVAGRRVELRTRRRGSRPGRRRSASAVVVEGALPQPLLAEPVEVDVGDRAPRPVGEALGLAEQVAASRRPSSGRPRTGRSSTRPGRRRRRGTPRCSARSRERTSSRRSSARATVIGLPERLAQHRRAGQRGLGARRHRHPHVLADLDVQREAGHVGGAEEQVGAERHLRRRRRRIVGAAALVVARRRSAGARRTRGSSAGSDFGATPRTSPRWMTTAQL